MDRFDQILEAIETRCASAQFSSEPWTVEAVAGVAHASAASECLVQGSPTRARERLASAAEQDPATWQAVLADFDAIAPEGKHPANCPGCAPIPLQRPAPVPDMPAARSSLGGLLAPFARGRR